MREPLTLLPAIDIRGGVVARTGGVERDPVHVAQDFIAEGATWLHIADLDAAHRTGNNAATVADTVAAVRGAAQVQLSGGIDSSATLEAALDTGAARVNLSATSLAQFPWVEEQLAAHGDRLAVCVDVLGERVVARGTGEDAGALDAVLERLEAAGARTLIVTDAARDGSLAGPNLPLLERVARRGHARVIASGGTASLGDVRALRELVPYGVSGAVVGSALHAGAFTLRDALSVAGGAA